MSKGGIVRSNSQYRHLKKKTFFTTNFNLYYAKQKGGKKHEKIMLLQKWCVFSPPQIG